MFFEGVAFLKRYLSIFNDEIFDSRVDRWTPSFAAAPVGPDTRPWHSRRAASMISFSWVASLPESSTWTTGSVARVGRESQLSSTEKLSVSHITTERSITFCNSRILPGHGYVCSRSRLFLLIA